MNDDLKVVPIRSSVNLGAMERITEQLAAERQQDELDAVCETLTKAERRILMAGYYIGVAHGMTVEKA